MHGGLCNPEDFWWVLNLRWIRHYFFDVKWGKVIPLPNYKLAVKGEGYELSHAFITQIPGMEDKAYQ